MSRTYDNWERLVDSVLRKQHDRELALAPSLESSFNSWASTADFSSRFSFDSPIHEVNFDASGISKHIIDSAIPSSSRLISSSYKAQKISFKELKKATKSFRYDMMLGGVFGDSYKGWIKESNCTNSKPRLIRFLIRVMNQSIVTAAKPGSGIAVVVKKLRLGSRQGKTEFLEEINYLSQIRHPNLVKLTGYCLGENNQPLLVYEFMPKGSLHSHLFERGYPSLSWATRIKVAIGVARGLSFLHNMEKQIVYGDCKPDNILLDEDFNAVLSDFSFATIVTHDSITVMGSYGYIAPEYVMTGHLTAKCDVYGFGVVLLQLISGRHVLDIFTVPEERGIVEWAKTYLHDNEEVIAIVDTKLDGQYPPSQAFAAAMLALQCIHEIPEERPTISDVAAALEQL